MTEVRYQIKRKSTLPKKPAR